ncbi:MAG: hypothetical protein JW764_07480 [Chlorobiaceae bacterium]|nr:hypothetical protein [Chlorobiaceae bacterium]
MVMEGEKEDVNLLWTGGWESTYRLCELIFLKKRIVNPVYILDPERKSFREEIKAMVAIRGEIVKRISSDASLLKPLQIVIKDDIPPNKIITEMYDSIVKTYGGLGRQFEWLARYADWKDLYRLEIGLEGNTNSPRRPVYAQLEKELIIKDESMILGNKLDDQLFDFFRRFSFPVFNLSKDKILQLAKGQDFYDLMLKTWFCHKPRNGKPCGRCYPCEQVMHEGMSFRIPLSGKVRYAFKKLF